MLSVGCVLRGIYRIDGYLSSGGFGNTYVATNMEFDEVVAIKEFFMKGVSQRDANNTTVSVSNSDNKTLFEEQKNKFKKEARRLHKLKNSHIVAVHDLFDENGTAYYVMDYIDGESLSERLKRLGRPLAEKEVMDYLPQILDALDCVHREGLWHLDLKPANVMVDRNRNVHLIDFGASKQRSASGGASSSTAVSYTSGFAPREQMEQNLSKFGPWTDLYALGATLYKLLTNNHPSLPSDIDDDLSADKHVALPFPENVSESIRNLVLRLMTTNRMHRPQSVEEVWRMIGGDEKPLRKEETVDDRTEESDKNVIGKGKNQDKQSSKASEETIRETGKPDETGKHDVKKANGTRNASETKIIGESEGQSGTGQEGGKMGTDRTVSGEAVVESGDNSVKDGTCDTIVNNRSGLGILIILAIIAVVFIAFFIMNSNNKEPDPYEYAEVDSAWIADTAACADEEVEAAADAAAELVEAELAEEAVD